MTANPSAKATTNQMPIDPNDTFGIDPGRERRDLSSSRRIIILESFESFKQDRDICFEMFDTFNVEYKSDESGHTAHFRREAIENDSIQTNLLWSYPSVPQSYLLPVDDAKVQEPVRKYQVATSWEYLESLNEYERTNFMDFHQTLDGVECGECDNCLFDICASSNATSKKAVVPVKANIPGSPLKLSVSFTESAAYVNFNWFLRKIERISKNLYQDCGDFIGQYEHYILTLDKASLPLLHVSGAWYETCHSTPRFDDTYCYDLGPIQVAGIRDIHTVAKEMCCADLKNKQKDREFLAEGVYRSPLNIGCMDQMEQSGDQVQYIALQGWKNG